MNNYTKIVTDKFLNTVHSYNMLKGVENVVVGFSGGADSVCLLHLLNEFKNRFGYNLKAVHINHGIRGEEAARDELFARDFCSAYEIPFELVRVNCIAEAGQSKESLEECGRRLRYQSFNALAEGKAKIATAHNANDNAETVIFNITRGSSVKGMCGIPFVRDNIIRPVLACSREEIEGYCSENCLTFVTDSTNLSDDYTRNKIRHKILPVMKELNPSFLDAFSSLSNNASLITDFLSMKATSLLIDSKKGDFTFSVKAFSDSHKAVACEAIFMAYKDFSGKALENKKVSALYDLLESGGRIQIYGNDFAEVRKGYLRFYRNDLSASDTSVIIDTVPFSTRINSYVVELEKIYNNSKIVNQMDYKNMVDYDTIIGKLVLRTRIAGDKFTFNKRGVTKTLKKLFTEENVPVEIREQIPVLADDAGVVWVQGFGVNKRCVPSRESSNIVIVKGEYNDR